MQTGAPCENSDETARSSASRKQDPLTFSKMAGGGNDFVVIDNRDRARSPTPASSRGGSARAALSVGADGLILVETSARATFRMRYYNSDGGLAEFCGERHPLRGALRVPERDRPAADDHRDRRRHRRRGDRRGRLGDALAAAAALVPRGPAADDRRADRPRQLDHGRRAALRDLPRRRSLVAGHRPPRPRDPPHRELCSRPARMRTSSSCATPQRSRCALTSAAWKRRRSRAARASSPRRSTSALFGKVQSPVSVLTRSGITLEVSFTLRDGERVETCG